MSSREPRGRFRREYPRRSDEKSHHSRGENPPSRHLWVGNLSHSLTEGGLAHHFLRYGELESIAFQPGRSFAFINYKNEEGAFVAIRELQGFVLAGNPLRIEFAKAEKSPPPRDLDYSKRRDEPRPVGRGSPFLSRDSRVRRHSPDPPYLDKSKLNEKDTPSEVLWIGFPAQLKVDEFILRKAFSPFGDIEKITAFPGRTYAFVRFRNVRAACKAKDTLHGKLFDNPRVHICFAKSDSGPNKERNPINAQASSHRSYRRSGSPEHFRPERDFSDATLDPGIRSPPLVRNFRHGDSDVLGLGRKSNTWAGGSDAYELRKYTELGSEVGLPGNLYDHQSSPPRERVRPLLREFSPQRFPRQGELYDDPWDLPEDDSFLHGAKKLKTNSFLPENELPEYPLSELEKLKPVRPMTYPDLRQAEVLETRIDSRPFGYTPNPDRTINSRASFGERNDHRSTSYDGFQTGPLPLPPNPELRRVTPELRESKDKEWRWEGTIAKGGTPVCHVRCFPVGKVMDMTLPEVLDCTARTSLEMLSKHYYQAVNAWVVFFVPASDPDIAFYNEFMNYLGEKQRAAVAKLDERTTLFLVPPSEFSEKILKVPGKMSLSGVILSLEPQGPSVSSLPQWHERKETTFSAFEGDIPYQKPNSPSGQYPSLPFANFERPRINAAPPPLNISSGASHASFSGSHPMSNISESLNIQQHDHMLHQWKPATGQSVSPHNLQSLNSDIRNFGQAAVSSMDFVGHGHSTIPRPVPETTVNDYKAAEIPSIPASGIMMPLQDTYPIPTSVPVAGLQPEQLGRLAASLLGQQRQSGISTVEDFRHTGNMNVNQPQSQPQSGYSYRTSQNHVLPNNQVPLEFSSSQYGQVPQQQQMPNMVAPPQTGFQPGGHMNQQLQNAEAENADGDPRLQATLHLAAALLQQLHQGKGAQ